ncbi:MAG: hypothetical protein JST83_17965 [Bacteroidetes bacterium]|nr:hypothetical protein [Bacteroidota bacterium]
MKRLHDISYSSKSHLSVVSGRDLLLRYKRVSVGSGRDLTLQAGRRASLHAWHRVSQQAVRAFLRLALSCFLLLASYISQAQISATFKGDSSKIEIGDYFNMKLVINAQPDIVVDFPSFPGDTIGKISIVRKDKIDTAKIGTSTIYSQNLTIQAYEGGQYIFTPLKVYYLNKTTRVIDSAYTNAYQLQVTEPAVDTTKPIKPIKAPLNVPYQLNEFYSWIAIGLVILAAIGIILYLRYKKKPAPVVARPRPKDPAHIWAARELKKLEDEKLWQKDQVKLYHSRLADILRSYLEFRYDYYALESTTGEIEQELDRLGISLDARSRIMETLRLADFVKFAKMNPAPDENMRSIQNAVVFVEQTKQIEVTPATAEAQQKTNKKKKK